MDTTKHWKSVTYQNYFLAQCYSVINLDKTPYISKTDCGKTFASHVIQVRNIAVSHTFRIEKARQELGFSPKKYTLADSVDQYLQSRPVPSASSLQESRSFLFVLMMMMMTMVLVGLVVLMLCPRWHQHQHQH